MPAELAIDSTDADILFRAAHTTYAFTDEPVSDDQLRAIIELMQLGPTAINAQPLRVAFLRGEAKDRLIQHLPDGNKPKSQSAPVVAVLAYDTDFHEHLPHVMPQNPSAKDNFADPERREGFARMSAQIQAGYFIVAARAVGLDAGPMGGVNAAGVDGEFFADTAWRTFMVVNLGHAAEGGQRPRNPRLAFETVTLLP